MRRSLKETRKQEKEALARAFQSLEGVKMTRREDPKLAELKDDIRRAIRAAGD